MTVRHPATFSDPILAAIDAALGDAETVLHPFAGIGGIHRLNRSTVGVELEPESAEQHPNTIVGNALDLPSPDDIFDAIATSPTYGNRMADHHDAKDGSTRHTYRHTSVEPSRTTTRARCNGDAPTGASMRRRGRKPSESSNPAAGSSSTSPTTSAEDSSKRSPTGISAPSLNSVSSTTKASPSRPDGSATAPTGTSGSATNGSSRSSSPHADVETHKDPHRLDQHATQQSLPGMRSIARRTPRRHPLLHRRLPHAPQPPPTETTRHRQDLRPPQNLSHLRHPHHQRPSNLLRGHVPSAIGSS